MRSSYFWLASSYVMQPLRPPFVALGQFDDGSAEALADIFDQIGIFWGPWIGFGIASAGTFVGEMLCYIVFRYYFTEKAQE